MYQRVIKELCEQTKGFHSIKDWPRSESVIRKKRQNNIMTERVNFRQTDVSLGLSYITH